MEAEAIAKQHYSDAWPEATERLKLSISTIADLIDRGAQILPADKNNDQISKEFPDYSKLNVIGSAIKQLKDGGT